MALTDENGGMVMPVQPMGNGGGFGGYGYPAMPMMPYMPYGNNGGMFGGGDSWLGILFLIALCNGGFGFGGFGGGYGAMMGMGMMDGFGLYPWLNNSQNINDGFREQMLNTSVNGIQNAVTSGFGDVQTALCGGFAGVNQNISQTGNGIVSAVNNAQNAIAQQMYGNEIAALERSFAAQTANTQGLTNLSSQLAQCCCDNRLATCQTQNIVQNEGNATRFADANNTRDIIDSQTRGTQAILDKLCALELDGVKSQLAQAQRENIGLQNAVNMATMQASQVAQTAELRASQATTANQLINELRSCPIPSQPVYGNSPIFTCAQNVAGNNSGCGCGYGFANG